jgi:hypothetical protein
MNMTLEHSLKSYVGLILQTIVLAGTLVGIWNLTDRRITVLEERMLTSKERLDRMDRLHEQLSNNQVLLTQANAEQKVLIEYLITGKPLRANVTPRK